MCGYFGFDGSTVILISRSIGFIGVSVTSNNSFYPDELVSCLIGDAPGFWLSYILICGIISLSFN